MGQLPNAKRGAEPNLLAPKKSLQIAADNHPKDPAGDQFMGVTLRGWAISAISAIAVALAICIALIKVYQQLQIHKATDVVVSTSLTDIKRSLKTVSSGTGQAAAEAQKHIQNNDRYEAVPIMHTGGITVTADYYPVDGCVHLWRDKGQTSAYGVKDQEFWMTAPEFVRPASASEHSISGKPQDLSSPISNEIVVSFPQDSGVSTPHLKQATATSTRPKLLNAAFQYNCLNPHPGYFQVQNVQLNECLVQVWRQFNDGCRHNQIYNACNGQWDPNINWAFCAIQHHP